MAASARRPYSRIDLVYNDWSAYDELSDSIPLTEELAMKELDEIIRLRSLGPFRLLHDGCFLVCARGGLRTAQAELA